MIKKQTKPQTRKKPARKKKNLGGRPHIISDQLVKDLVFAIHNGAYIETAAAYAGMARPTFYVYLKRGARAKTAVFNPDTGEHDYSQISFADRPFVRFIDTIKKALAVSELDDLSTINEAKGKNWQAAAWKLERRFPQRYGRKLQGRVSMTVGDGEYEDIKQDAPSASEDGAVADGPVLNPHKPVAIHLTLAIGDREIEIGDLEDNET